MIDQVSPLRFDDFVDIYHGKREPSVNNELLARMDSEVMDPSELSLLRCISIY